MTFNVAVLVVECEVVELLVAEELPVIELLKLLLKEAVPVSEEDPALVATEAIIVV